MGLEPFDKHPANVGELEGLASGLIAKGGEGLQNGKATRQAYTPAIQNWDGLAAPELAAAAKPVPASAQETNGALIWAATCTKMWAGLVKYFNFRVDAIVAAFNAQGPSYGAKGTGGKAPTDAEKATAKTEALNKAKEEYRNEYNQTIVQGGAEVAGMLKQGPTAENMAKARFVGALDGQGWNPYKDIEGGAKSIVMPNGQPFGGLSYALWGIGLGLGRGGNLATIAQKMKYGQPIPRIFTVGADGTNTITNSTRWKQLFSPKMGKGPQFNGLAGTTKWLGRAGTVLSFATSALDQWSRDSGRTDIGTGEKVARTAYRGAAVAAGAYAGAKGGALLGATIGSAIPGVGTVVGGVVGGIVGGIVGGVIGSGIANKIVDHTVDWVGDKVSDVGSAIGDGAKKVWKGIFG